MFDSDEDQASGDTTKYQELDSALDTLFRDQLDTMVQTATEGLAQSMFEFSSSNNDYTRVLSLIDLDQMFLDSEDARIVNNDLLVSKNLSSGYTNVIYSNGSDSVDFVPTCRCGALRGKSNIGLTCSLCGTECSQQFVDKIEHESWAAISRYLPCVLHPVWYIILKKWTGGNNSAIDILLNPDKEVPKDLKGIISEDKSERGFTYFHDHVDEILDAFMTKYKRKTTKMNVEAIRTMLQYHGHCMFTRHLPLLHSSLHPKKSNGAGQSYIDKSSSEILGAVSNLSTLAYKAQVLERNPSTRNRASQRRRIESALYNVYTSFIAYYEDLIKSKLASKPGLLRKHVFGSRIHFSLRTVVVPHDHVAPMDEVILPWGTILNGLKLPIINYLRRRHHLPHAEAIDKFMHALTNYDADIDHIVEELIYQYPTHRLPVVIGRNPTVNFGSIMLLYVREYRKDPNDQTMSISAGIVKPANIDFDGDELYGFFVFEDRLRRALMAIHPSQFLFDVSYPGLSASVGLLSQNVICLENYLRDDPDSDYYEEI